MERNLAVDGLLNLFSKANRHSSLIHNKLHKEFQQTSGQCKSYETGGVVEKYRRRNVIPEGSMSRTSCFETGFD